MKEPKVTEEWVDDPILGRTKAIIVDMGDHVVCDSCNGDYTHSKEEGGISFHGRALCPECAPEWTLNAEKYNEEGDIIKNTTGKSFADWVREDLR